jgi:Family of unknown function (DUF6494)
MGPGVRRDDTSSSAVYDRATQEAIMNEDTFNSSLRGFLKKVGITSQREIEKAVRDALASGRLKGHEKLPAKMVLTVGGVNLTHEITAEIELG